MAGFFEAVLGGGFPEVGGGVRVVSSGPAEPKIRPEDLDRYGPPPPPPPPPLPVFQVELLSSERKRISQAFAKICQDRLRTNNRINSHTEMTGLLHRVMGELDEDG
eukprot:COSAG06_NODE_1763_length_8449_cov_184.922275_2_plen_106_part_00